MHFCLRPLEPLERCALLIEESLYKCQTHVQTILTRFFPKLKCTLFANCVMPVIELFMGKLSAPSQHFGTFFDGDTSVRRLTASIQLQYCDNLKHFIKLHGQMKFCDVTFGAFYQEYLMSLP